MVCYVVSLLSSTDEQLAVFDEFCSELSSWCDQHNEHGVTASLPHLGNYVAVRCGHSTSTVPGGGGAWIRGMVTNHIDRYVLYSMKFCVA